MLLVYRFMPPINECSIGSYSAAFAEVLSSPVVDASTLSAMLGEGSDPADIDRLLSLRAAGDGEVALPQTMKP